MELGITLERALPRKSSCRSATRKRRKSKHSSTWRASSKVWPATRVATPGGVVIAPCTLTEFTPLYCEQQASGSVVVTQLDKDDVESIGLVKFDFPRV